MAKEKKVIRRTRYEDEKGKVTVIVVYDDFSSVEEKEAPKPEVK